MLNGQVDIEALASEGGDGGAAGDGGGPGNRGFGETSSGAFGAFGANGSAGNGANGGDGGMIDVYVTGNLHAAAPYNILATLSGRAGSGGSGADGTCGYLPAALLNETIKGPGPTVPGSAGIPGAPGSIRVRIGGTLGTSSTDVLLGSAIGGQGGVGGSLGSDCSSNDASAGTSPFPGTGNSGSAGGDGGTVEIDAAQGLNGSYDFLADGGKGGDGGTGGTFNGPHMDQFIVAGGNGGNGGKGGTVVARIPGISASVVAGNFGTDTSAGDGGAGGAGTHQANNSTGGSTGQSGSVGGGGTATLTDAPTSGAGSVALFPMTLHLETVPLTQTSTPVGGVVLYRATFTNNSTLAISNFTLTTDALDPHSQAITNSAGPQGSWNAATGVFATTPVSLAPGDVVIWEFSVTTIGPYAANTSVINGVQALGMFNSNTELDHAVASLSLASAAVSFTDDPLTPRTTRVKAIHIAELRQAIDTLRSGAGLGAFSWTDTALTSGMPVKAIHILDLRSALNAVYTAKSVSLPTYRHAMTVKTTTITALDIAELRTAVLAIW